MPRLSVAVLLLCLIGGCAALPNGKPDPRDRFERFNRAVYKFNVIVDHAILRPVARTYVRVLPRPVRTSINNFLSNIHYPVNVVNSLLEGKLDNGVSDAARLVVNTTLGIGGLFDPATNMGLERHPADFGLTLGVWGIRNSPYLMLPLLGPSTVRDAIGMVPDYLFLHEIETVRLLNNNEYVEWGVGVVAAVNTRAQLLDTDRLLDAAFDPYALLRSAYLQRRAYQISNGEITPEEDLPPEDDSGDSPPAK